MAAPARRLGMAGHPVVVGSLVVLAANDRVLKGWSADHGALARTLTGKASDLAGVLLLAVMAGLATRRRRPAVIGVGLAFILLKLSPAVADLAVPLLGGRTRTDPWDLLALAALLPADRLLRRLDDDQPAPHPRPAQVPLRATLGLAVLLLSVPAMTATSTPMCRDRSAVVDLALVDGVVYAHLGPTSLIDDPRPTDQYDIAQWFRSTDVGETWTDSVPPPRADQVVVDEPVREGCTTARCYRTVDDEVQERTDGGTWTTSFAFGPGEQETLERLDHCPLPAPVDVVVARDAVVVAHGTQGVLTRLDGEGWERRPVGWAGPTSTAPLATATQLLVVAGILFLAADGLIVVSRRRTGSRAGPIAGILLALGACLAALGAGVFAPKGNRSQGIAIAIPQAWLVPGLVALVAAIALVVVALDQLVRRIRER